jgi:outer membrane lipoprotein LolB
MKNLPLLLCLLLALQACTTTPSRNPHSRLDQFDAHQAALQLHPKWQLSGKLGIKSPQQTASAFINWKQNDDTFRLHLSGPFGQGSITLNGDGDQLSIQQNGLNQAASKDPQAILKSRLGWEIPARQLRYWARGIPSPHSIATQVTVGKNGLLDELQQDNWLISYPRYTRHRLALPEKIILKRDQLKLTLIIHQWN